MIDPSFIPIRDLAVIGDRHTCACISKQGEVVWYCPGRFDSPSLFAALLDPGKGGTWRLTIEGFTFDKRAYLPACAVLQTFLKGKDGASVTVEDWMPVRYAFSGICRKLSPSPVPIDIELEPKPAYAQEEVLLEQSGKNSCVIQSSNYFYASHPLTVTGGNIKCRVPAGEASWFVLADAPADISSKTVEESREAAIAEWRKLAQHIVYEGPYQEEVNFSLRMLRLMTYDKNGGMIAAGTTSLPEIPGGSRNYDYRFVWLRDAAMIVSALTRAGSDGEEGRVFLSFISEAMQELEEPDVPLFTLDCALAPDITEIDLQGYANSRPVRVGNGAHRQLQLDAISNVLLAAKLVYGHYDTLEHWEMVSRLADYLVDHWHETGHGLWEECEKRQYTSSKVVAAVSLEYIAEYAEDADQQERWKRTAQQIREYVAQHCLTSEGAYAAYAGAEAVDISAILFPTWGYVAADAPEVLKTVEVLERDHCQNHLFRRHLTETDSQKEGVFLAGTFWMAQYWVMRRDWEKFETIMEAALNFMNDVGVMPEEGDPETGEFLGNIPQTFVHASLIGAVIDYKNALESDSQK